MTILFGAASAVAWIWVRAQLEGHVRKDHLGTIAILFGMAGGAEWLGLSGSVAALVFGLGLANVHSLPGLRRLVGDRVGALTPEEQYFVHELSFVLKTFFFLYVGLLISINDWVALLLAALIVFVQHAVRPLSVRLSLPRSMLKRDVATAAALVPKGTVAVVLARVLIHHDVPGAALLSDIAMDAVVISIVSATVLVLVLERGDPGRLFGSLFRGYAAPPVLVSDPAPLALVPAVEEASPPNAIDRA
jgi:NhaP-type Na+/H+ or K+/H+ antiporter